MEETSNLPESDAERVIERGKAYNHSEHGRVEVNGIWRGVHKVDSAYNTKESGTIIVRYSITEDGPTGKEITATLNEFLEDIE